MEPKSPLIRNVPLDAPPTPIYHFMGFNTLAVSENATDHVNENDTNDAFDTESIEQVQNLKLEGQSFELPKQNVEKKRGRPKGVPNRKPKKEKMKVDKGAPFKAPEGDKIKKSRGRPRKENKIPDTQLQTEKTELEISKNTETQTSESQLKESRTRPMEPQKLATKTNQIASSSTIDSRTTLSFNRDAILKEMFKCADILRSHGDKVVISVKSHSTNTFISYPNEVIQNLTSFFSSNFGLDFKTTTNTSYATPPDLIKKIQQLRHQILDLYCSQMNLPKAKNIDWYSVDVDGWPVGIGRDVKYLSEEELELVSDAFYTSKIKFKRKKQ